MGNCKCNEGFWLSNGSCINCSAGCKICYYTDYCFQCYAPYILVDYKCLIECPYGYIK
jgi:hypothetical protein